MTTYAFIKNPFGGIIYYPNDCTPEEKAAAEDYAACVLKFDAHDDIDRRQKGIPSAQSCILANLLEGVKEVSHLLFLKEEDIITSEHWFTTRETLQKYRDNKPVDLQYTNQMEKIVFRFR